MPPTAQNANLPPLQPVNIQQPNFMQGLVQKLMLARMGALVNGGQGQGGQWPAQQQSGQDPFTGQPTGNNGPGFNQGAPWLQSLFGGGQNLGNVNTGGNAWNNALTNLFGMGTNNGNGGNGAGGNPYGNVWGPQGLWGSR